MFAALLERLAGLLGGGSAGRRGERAAAAYLRRQGYRIAARNLRSRLGEVDILAQDPDGRTVVIVEVKAAEVNTDAPARGPLPEVHVNRDKQRKLSALAAHLARQYGWDRRPIRFDVIGVDLPRRGQPVIRHHPNAFGSTL